LVTKKPSYFCLFISFSSHFSSRNEYFEGKKKKKSFLSPRRLEGKKEDILGLDIVPFDGFCLVPKNFLMLSRGFFAPNSVRVFIV
jgi:hypothetical protein